MMVKPIPKKKIIKNLTILTVDIQIIQYLYMNYQVVDLKRFVTGINRKKKKRYATNSTFR
jgi:hypothetical protein